MDTNWNSTSESIIKVLEEHGLTAEEAGKPALPQTRKKRRAKPFFAFLAFFLGVSLLLSSLGGMVDRLLWQRDQGFDFRRDWQDTQAFRNEASRYLRGFLTIGAGGVPTYPSVWLEEFDDLTLREAEVIQEAVTGTGFQIPQEATTTDSTGEHYVFLQPAENPVPQEPDAAYQADQNVLYLIRCGKNGNWKTYCNGDQGLAAFRNQTLGEAYNFYLSFRDGKVSAVWNGQELDVYGSGVYDGDSLWFVPGYDNFPAGEQLKDVEVYLAVRQTPLRYYALNYADGSQLYTGGMYSVFHQTQESREFYRRQACLLGAGVLCLLLSLALNRSFYLAKRKIACWTQRVWTEARFLLGAVLTGWVLLSGTGDLYYLLRDAYWSGSWCFADLGRAVSRLFTSNLPGLLALVWFFWLLRNDHKYNGKDARRSFLGPFFRELRAKDLKRPVEKRLSQNHAAVLLVLGVLLLAEAGNWILFLCRMFPGKGIALTGVMLFIQLPLGVLAIPLALLFFRLWKSRGLAGDLGRLADQVEAVRGGDLRKPLRLPEDADLRKTADSLNDIQAGMKTALEEQTRSERMKVELVSNVSHDLKTPLTSILSYAELLRQEPDLSPAAADYARIIDEKAQRLNTIVQDVFEISKAAADQLPVHLERLDLAKLLRQTLADLDGPIQASALHFRTELPQEAVLVTADGRRLYRVFQNLIDNALRYALEGSRVYLSLTISEKQATASLRNTSREELPTGVDFTARFVRGDASRTGGGSGLGLSIAKSFTEACGGSFQVETMADLFTVSVRFPLAE
ncbi:MAG: HAMP domain-containing histidine kinase [Oscillibacter sp.]|nr:HAMP domain-containing histidine kinase [Oscillibacter sp.]